MLESEVLKSFKSENFNSMEVSCKHLNNDSEIPNWILKEIDSMIMNEAYNSYTPKNVEITVMYIKDDKMNIKNYYEIPYIHNLFIKNINYMMDRLTEEEGLYIRINYTEKF